MGFSDHLIVFVYFTGILMQNDTVFAQSSGDPCVFHDVMDSVDIVRYANSISGPTCLENTVNGGWYRFGSTGTGGIITSCPTANQCGGGNRIWINGTVPGHSVGVFSRHACVKTGSSCCSRALPVSMKSCGSYFIYNIGQFPPCSAICLVQTTAIVITNPTLITQNTVTASSVTNTFLTGATEKDSAIQTTIIVVSTVGVVVIVLALLAVFAILVLRRRGQQNATNQDSPASPTSDYFASNVNLDASDHYQDLDQFQSENPSPTTISNATYSGNEDFGSDTHEYETHSNVDIDHKAGSQETSFVDNTTNPKDSNHSMNFGSDAIDDSVRGNCNVSTSGSDSVCMVNTQLSTNVDGKLMPPNDRSK